MLQLVVGLVLLNFVLSNPQYHSSFIVPIHQEDKLVGGLLEREIIVPIIQRDRMVGKPQQTYEIVVPHFENKNIAGGFSQQQYKDSSPYGHLEKKNTDSGTSQQQHKVPVVVSGPYKDGGSSQQQYKVPIVVSGPHELVIPYNNYISGTHNPKEVVPIHEENQSGEKASPGDYEFEREEEHVWSINNDRYKYPLQEYKAKEPPKKFESLKEYKAKEPPKKFESLKKQEEYIAGKNHSNKIVGGHGASITDYPYQLSLVLWRRFHFCGAVLISEKWALTAAHCTYGKFADDLSVRAGSSTFSGGQVVPVSQIIEHENYFQSSVDYDISMLELSANVDSAHAKPIALTDSRPKAGDQAIVSGWGRTAANDRKAPAVLQVLKVPVVDQKQCKDIYGKSKSTKFKVTDRMFCAGKLEHGGEGVCLGDSGGPIVVGGKLAGLVSWGRACAVAGYPGVFASIADLKDWVKENIQRYTY